MAKTDYTGRVNRFISPFLEKNGYTLIGTEFVNEDGNWYLRLYIDLTEEELAKRQQELEQADEDTDDEAAADDDEAVVPGVSINDCVKVSRYLSKWLDKEDFIKEAYTMEVCSRGFLNGGQLSAGEEGEG